MKNKVHLAVKRELQYSILYAKNDIFSLEGLLTDHGEGNQIEKGYRLKVGRWTIIRKRKF